MTATCSSGINAESLNKFMLWLNQEYDRSVEEHKFSLCCADALYWHMQEVGATSEILRNLNKYCKEVRIYSEYSEYLLTIFSIARESPEQLLHRHLYNPVRSIAQCCGIAINHQLYEDKHYVYPEAET